MIKILVSEPLYFSNEIRENLPFSEERKRIKVDTRTGKLIPTAAPTADPTEKGTSEPAPAEVKPPVVAATGFFDPSKSRPPPVAPVKPPTDFVPLSQRQNNPLPPQTASPTAAVADSPPPTAPMASGGTKPEPVEPPAPAASMSKGGVKIGVSSALGGKGKTRVKKTATPAPTKGLAGSGQQPGKPPTKGPVKSSDKVYTNREVELETEKKKTTAAAWKEYEGEPPPNAPKISKPNSKDPESEDKAYKEKERQDKERAAIAAQTAAHTSEKEAKQVGWQAGAAVRKAQRDKAATKEAEKKAKEAQAVKDQEAEMWASAKPTPLTPAAKASQVKAAYSAAAAETKEKEGMLADIDAAFSEKDVATQKDKADAEGRAAKENPNFSNPEPVAKENVVADVMDYGAAKKKASDAQKERVFHRVVGVEKNRLQGILDKNKERERALKHERKVKRMRAHAASNITNAFGAMFGTTLKTGKNVLGAMTQGSKVHF